MDARLKITDVTGPYREPREPVFSYDYSIQRASWPTAQAVRVKVAIPEELEFRTVSVTGLPRPIGLCAICRENDPSRMLKKSASGVLTSKASST